MITKHQPRQANWVKFLPDRIAGGRALSGEPTQNIQRAPKGMPISMEVGGDVNSKFGVFTGEGSKPDRVDLLEKNKERKFVDHKNEYMVNAPTMQAIGGKDALEALIDGAIRNKVSKVQIPDKNIKPITTTGLPISFAQGGPIGDIGRGYVSDEGKREDQISAENETQTSSEEMPWQAAIDLAVRTRPDVKQEDIYSAVNPVQKMFVTEEDRKTPVNVIMRDGKVIGMAVKSKGDYRRIDAIDQILGKGGFFARGGPIDASLQMNTVQVPKNQPVSFAPGGPIDRLKTMPAATSTTARTTGNENAFSNPAPVVNQPTIPTMPAAQTLTPPPTTDTQSFDFTANMPVTQAQTDAATAKTEATANGTATDALASEVAPKPVAAIDTINNQTLQNFGTNLAEGKTNLQMQLASQGTTGEVAQTAMNQYDEQARTQLSQTQSQLAAQNVAAQQQGMQQALAAGDFATYAKLSQQVYGISIDTTQLQNQQNLTNLNTAMSTLNQLNTQGILSTTAPGASTALQELWTASGNKGTYTSDFAAQQVQNIQNSTNTTYQAANAYSAKDAVADFFDGNQTALDKFTYGTNPPGYKSFQAAMQHENANGGFSIDPATGKLTVLTGSGSSDLASLISKSNQANGIPDASTGGGSNVSGPTTANTAGNATSGDNTGKAFINSKLVTDSNGMPVTFVSTTANGLNVGKDNSGNLVTFGNDGQAKALDYDTYQKLVSSNSMPSIPDPKNPGQNLSKAAILAQVVANPDNILTGASLDDAASALMSANSTINNLGTIKVSAGSGGSTAEGQYQGTLQQLYNVVNDGTDQATKWNWPGDGSDANKRQAAATALTQATQKAANTLKDTYNITIDNAMAIITAWEKQGASAGYGALLPSGVYS